jgi:hypothetical protein
MPASALWMSRKCNRSVAEVGFNKTLKMRGEAEIFGCAGLFGEQKANTFGERSSPPCVQRPSRLRKRSKFRVNLAKNIALRLKPTSN